MATRAPIMPPVNETEHSVSRITREGKKLTYKLSVMQQPERARACGAGAKSSADRRPVDPPPVVELRIFESDPADDMHKTDITFAYNANFFLFATLDTARPVAQGRVPAVPSCPVLTGVPVAGVAYLDRPTQAGYFIFPDLSVRHEGRYRLNFHLYEEIKDPKDADKDAPVPAARSPLSKPAAPQSSLHFRLEVKSVPFTVFSAKKFPGLATSTSLSRIIAEQGCRVRIRRDVRMRRRGEKRTDDYEFEEDRVYPRSTDRYTTPDGGYAATPVERPRSTSTGAADPAFGYAPDAAAAAARRPSATDYGFPAPQPYQRPPMPPAPPAPAPPTPSSHTSHAQPYSHLSFGSTQAQYQAPLPPTPLSANPTTNASNPPTAYSPRVPYSHTRSSSNTTEYEPPSNGYPFPQPRPADRSSYPKTAALPPLLLEPPKSLTMPASTERRSSNPVEYQSMGPSVPRAPTPSNMVTSLPPLKTLSGEFAPNSLPQPPSSLPSPSLELGGKRLLYETGPSLAKRSHEDTFGHDDRPLHNGMRPDADSYPSTSPRLFDSRRVMMFPDFSRDEMAYKRANGRMAMKIPPALQ